MNGLYMEELRDMLPDNEEKSPRENIVMTIESRSEDDEIINTVII